VLAVRPVTFAETSTGLSPAFLVCFFGSHPRALVGETMLVGAGPPWLGNRRGVCCSGTR
jgi:hypothetical protein